MKNVIMYYYNMKNITIHKVNNRTLIKNKGEIYIFQEIFDQKKTFEIFKLTRNNSNFYPFVINKDQSIFTPYKGKIFVLLKRISPKFDSSRNYIGRNYQISKLELNRKDWKNLWQQKVDYYEYQMNHIEGKFPIIDESINYYIGMTENAISFLSYNSIDNEDFELVTCHHRVIDDEFEFYNPLNLVVDHKEREFGEYLKDLFWSNKYKNRDLYKIIKDFNCTKSGYYRLYARVLYPSYYFDLYDKIVNEREKTDKMNKIISRIDEYESFLLEIHEIISTFFELPSIDWLKKI